ncbi:MAG: S-layer homology domain-containing protein [Clostridia bacterium]|nr:S-layer homology domain-containing protein [Clostridia bacterium]
MKRVLSFVATLLMLLSMLGSFAVVSADLSTKLVVEATDGVTTAKAGDQVTYTVYIDNYADNFCTAQILIDFDPAVLSLKPEDVVVYKEVDYDGEIITNYFFNSNYVINERKQDPGDEPGEIGVMWASASPVTKTADKVRMMILNFTVLDDAAAGETAIDIYFAKDGQAKDATSEWVDDVDYTKHADITKLTIVGDAVCEHVWGKPVHTDGTEGAAATHTYTCQIDGCDETKVEACSFTEIGTTPGDCVTAPTATYKCDKCDYEYTIATGTAGGEHTNVGIRYYAPDHTANGENGWIEHYCYDCNTQIELIEDLDAGVPYPDLSNHNVWFYDAAVYCKSFGIITGTTAYGSSETIFGGGITMTRGQAVTILGRLMLSQADMNAMSNIEFEEFLAEQESKVAANPTPTTELTDVSGKWYSRYARLLSKWGIVTGYDDGGFHGDEPVNRIQMATFMMRFVEAYKGDTDITIPGVVGKPASSFTDASIIAEWGMPYVDWASRAGILTGRDTGAFDPYATLSRGEMAMIMFRVHPVLADVEIVSVYNDRV